MIDRSRWAAVCLAAFLGCPWALGADDSLDSLFDQPPADQVAVTPAKTEVPEVDQPVRAFGTLAFDGTGITGTGGTHTYSAYLDSSLKVGVDVRPDDKIRIQGSVITELPSANNPFLVTPSNPFVITTNTSGTNSLQYSTPVVDELFVDYTAGTWGLFRAGQFNLTWGQARLVYNYGDLILGTNQGLTVKGAFPVGSGTLTLMTSGYGALDAAAHPAEYLTAGSLDQTWGPVTWGAAGAFGTGPTYGPAVTYGVAGAYEQECEASAFAKTSFWGFDWYLEGSGIFESDGQSGPWNQVNGLFGFNWQGGFPVWTVNVENQLSRFHDYPGATQYTTEAAVSIDGKVPWAGFSPKLQWSQAWEDRSGELVAALTYQAQSFLSFTLGIPLVYGADGTRFVAANIDPAGRRLSVGLKTSFSYSF